MDSHDHFLLYVALFWTAVYLTWGWFSLWRRTTEEQPLFTERLCHVAYLVAIPTSAIIHSAHFGWALYTTIVVAAFVFKPKEEPEPVSTGFQAPSMEFPTIPSPQLVSTGPAAHNDLTPRA